MCYKIKPESEEEKVIITTTGRRTGKWFLAKRQLHYKINLLKPDSYLIVTLKDWNNQFEKGKQQGREEKEAEWKSNPIIHNAWQRGRTETLEEAQNEHKTFESHYHEDDDEPCEYCKALEALKKRGEK